jgi:ABC-type phosphate transport system ATPase subunit
MIADSDFLTLVDYCDRMNLIQSALFSVLNRVHPFTDNYTFEIEMLIFDLLITENQRVVNEFRQEITLIQTSPTVNMTENDRN